MKRGQQQAPLLHWAHFALTETIRLDRFLWFARLSASRTFAQQLASAGHLRIDGRPIDKPAHRVRIGNVLTFVTSGGEIKSLRVETIPSRRCPPAEARACYTDLIDAERSRI